MTMRHRVNISVDKELYGRMRKVVKRYGFANLCRLAVASIRTVLDAEERVRGARGLPKPDTPDPDDHIAEMFREYAEAENGRNGIRAKTGAHQVK